jgi:hypothetical protein
MADLTDPIVTTDQQDYAPGSVATITASGFGAGADLNLSIQVIDPATSTVLWNGANWNEAADSSGSVATFFSVNSSYANTTIQLTVTDPVTGQTAIEVFTDAPVAEPALPSPLANDVDLATAKLVNPVTADGAIWGGQGSTLETVGASGTGNFNTFSRLQANGSEQGFNTDAQNPALNEKASIHTHSLTLNSLQTVDATGHAATTGTLYYEFKLDINEKASAPYLSLDALHIMQASGGSLNSLAAIQADAQYHSVYDLGPNHVLLNAGFGTGSGNGAGTVD